MRCIRSFFLIPILALLASPTVYGQLRGPGSDPVEPFRVIGEIYYIGAVEISSHLIATSE